jgi:transketolase
VLSRGSDLTLVTSGVCTEEALRATAVLRERGLSIEHLHVSTLKPCNSPVILEALAKPNYGVVSLENHLVTGGLGSILAEKIADAGLGVRLTRLGLQDTFAHGASKPYLMREYGLDALALTRAVEQMVGQPLNIKEEELAAVRLDAVHSDHKVEAL